MRSMPILNNGVLFILNHLMMVNYYSFNTYRNGFKLFYYFRLSFHLSRSAFPVGFCHVF
jgi:hypothetical protein